MSYYSFSLNSTPLLSIKLSKIRTEIGILDGITIKLQITVADTGAGLTKQEIAKLFQTFSRAGAGKKLDTQGTGLGLYVAKQFIDMHKGKIWAESPGRGKGSSFFVELPLK